MLAPILTIRIANRSLDRLSRITRRRLGSLRRGLRSLTHTFSEGSFLVLALRSVGPLVRVDLILAVFFDELGEIFDGAGSGVGYWRFFATGWEKLDCWEALDLIWHVVRGGVDFGDCDFGAGRVLGG